MGSDHQVFAIVTRDRITQGTMGGDGSINGRAICWTDGESLSQSVVRDDWRLWVRVQQ
jgi:hypothetical protein